MFFACEIYLTFTAALALSAAAAPTDEPSSGEGMTSRDIPLTRHTTLSSQVSMASASVVLASSSSISNTTGDAADEASVAALSGRATYYTPNNDYGACGKRIKNSEHAVALSSDKSYAGGAHCGKKITAHHNGKKVVATVRDLCPGCAANSLDLTPSAFKKLAKLGKGNIAVNWKFN